MCPRITPSPRPGSRPRIRRPSRAACRLTSRRRVRRPTDFSRMPKRSVRSPNSVTGGSSHPGMPRSCAASNRRSRRFPWLSQIHDPAPAPDSAGDAPARKRSTHASHSGAADGARITWSGTSQISDGLIVSGERDLRSTVVRRARAVKLPCRSLIGVVTGEQFGLTSFAPLVTLRPASPVASTAGRGASLGGSCSFRLRPRRERLLEPTPARQRRSFRDRQRLTRQSAQATEVGRYGGRACSPHYPGQSPSRDPRRASTRPREPVKRTVAR